MFNPKSEYAPVRQRDSFWWRYARDIVHENWITLEGEQDYRMRSAIEEELLRPMKLMIANAEFQSETQVPHLLAEKGREYSLAKVRDYGRWIPVAAHFERCGRQIFDLTDELVRMLSHTDVSECTLEDWNPPYNAFFLRFGKQSSLCLLDNTEGAEKGSPEYVDGAFVSVAQVGPSKGQRVISFGLTTVNAEGEGFIFPGYLLEFPPETQRASMSAAVDKALSLELTKIMGESGDSNEGALKRLQSDNLKEVAELLQKSANLVINSLFYIESIAQPPLMPGRGTPDNLAKKWETANSRQKEKIKSKLTSEGYTVVRLLGKEFQESADYGTGTGDVRAHWRRGHWRQQAYGEHMSLRRRTWIRPVLVKASALAGELPGHIYQTNVPHLTQNRP